MTTAPETPRMGLASISRGKIEQPEKICIYGLDGVGKSTLAAAAPKPIFLAAETGTAQLDVARFPQPKTWEDVLAAIRELATGEHDFETLVIDTMDALEPLAHAAICEKDGKKSIEEFGFGKGYNISVEYWTTLLSYLERLQERRGMRVILLGQAVIKPYNNPGGEDYDRWGLALHKRIAPLIRRWCDEVLFANYDVFTREVDGKHKGIGNGDRVLHTTREAAHDAKSRHGLPEQLPMDWDTLAEGLKNGNDNNNGAGS